MSSRPNLERNQLKQCCWCFKNIIKLTYGEVEGSLWQCDYQGIPPLAFSKTNLVFYNQLIKHISSSA